MVPDEVVVLLQDGEQGLQVEHAGSHVIAARGSSVTILWRAERIVFFIVGLFEEVLHDLVGLITQSNYRM